MSKTWITETELFEDGRPASGFTTNLSRTGDPPTAPAPAEEELASFEIPGYRPLQRLGRGGMGEVWLADRIGDTGVGVRCALKVILPERQNEQAFRRHFLSEARTSAQLRHPNVVTIFDVGQIDDRLYMAMEWVDGLDVRGLVRKLRKANAQLPLKHALYILRSVLQGLHYAHNVRGDDGQPMRMVHRDISPENLLLSREGAVKLSDFGVAWSAHSGTTPRAIGKLHYFAPELLHGAPASVRSDLFALGVTFYEMIAMKPLFDRRQPLAATRDAVRSFQPSALFEQDLSLPDELEQILRRALAPDPEDRYTSALELLEDVNDYLYEAGIRLLDAHFSSWMGKVLEL